MIFERQGIKAGSLERSFLIHPGDLDQSGNDLLTFLHRGFIFFGREVRNITTDLLHTGNCGLIMKDILKGRSQNFCSWRRHPLGDHNPAPEVNHHVNTQLFEGGYMGNKVPIPLMAELGQAFQLSSFFVGAESWGDSFLLTDCPTGVMEISPSFKGGI